MPSTSLRQRACRVVAGLLLVAAPVRAQDPAPATAATTPAPPAAASAAPQSPAPQPGLPRWARISFFASGASTSSDGDSTTFGELVTTVKAESAKRDTGGLQYGVDLRVGAYPSMEERDPRVSIYDAYVGQVLAGGRVFVKAGQMWLNDLGALGSVGGGLAEVRAAPEAAFKWRVGAFGGVEPEILKAAYVPGVAKYGAYVALDDGGAHKHVLGYVNVRNHSLTERSVLTMTNYVPVRQRLWIYQAAEFDLAGPGGQGDGGLRYLFVNARVAPVKRVDLQTTYHRGRSIDVRGISEDILAGRPVPAKALDGYLYESVGGRVTVEVMPGLRVFGGYAEDRNDDQSDPTGRVTFGLFSSNLFGTGIDLNVTDYRYRRGSTSSYDSWYVSAGRSLGSRVYLSADYATSLSFLRYIGSDGVTIDTKPNTKQYGASVNVFVARSLSGLINVEWTDATGYTELRGLAGVTCRF